MSRADTAFYLATVALAAVCAVLMFHWVQRMGAL